MPRQGRYRVPRVLPRPPVVEQSPRRRSELEHIIEAVGLGADAARIKVEIEAGRAVTRFIDDNARKPA